MDTKSASTKNFVVALLAAGALWTCLFSGLSAVGLTGPDEPRYAWIARNMAATGDWVTPVLYGKPWFEKPILYYWTAAANFRHIHSPELAARLPSAFAALVAALAMGWLAWRRYGAATAEATLLIFPACIGVIAFSRAATPDMLFTGALAMALVSAAAVAETNAWQGEATPPRTRGDTAALLFLGVWIGVATLAKGPAAILLAGGSVLIWAIFSKNWRIAFRMLHPIAVVSFCAVALPWYVLCAIRNPDFFHTFIVLHNFERYLTPVFEHRQPFWFFGPILLIGLLPWSALLGGFIWDAWRLGREKSVGASSGFFIACWAIFPLIFFSFSDSKLPSYILPAFPPFALLLAHTYVAANEKRTRAAPLLGIATGIMWTVLGVAGAVALLGLHPSASLSGEQIHHLAWIALSLGIAAGIVVEILSLTRRPRAMIYFSTVFVAALVLVANLRVMPKLDPLLSTRHAVAMWREEPSSAVPRWPLYQLDVNRDCAYGIAFYRGNYPEDWNSAARRPALVLVGKGASTAILAEDGLKEINGNGADWGRCGDLYYAEPRGAIGPQ